MTPIFAGKQDLAVVSNHAVTSIHGEQVVLSKERAQLVLDATHRGGPNAMPQRPLANLVVELAADDDAGSVGRSLVKQAAGQHPCSRRPMLADRIA